MLIRSRCALLALFAIIPLIAQDPAAVDWQKVTDLPALDVSGLSPKQKATLLQIVREETCTCNCGMKIAECRVKDPGCGDSRTLASIAAQEIKAGKTPEQIRAALKNSELARSRRANLFGEPVALTVNGSPSRGPANARITLVEFSDFQCPYCRVAAKKVSELLDMFPNDVRLVFKEFPLDEHSQAAAAAEAALAAHAQGKFWPLHDRMFAQPGALKRESFLAWAKEFGLDVPRFTADLDSGKYRQEVMRDLKEGLGAGVQGTPSFFLNGRQYRGPMEPATLKPIIEEELKKLAPAMAKR